jgi:nicotinamidase-related amidase
MSFSLIVIDMQRAFTASRDRKTIASCKEQIKQAMEKQAAIVFVEFFGYGKTMPALTNLTKHYSRKQTVIKNKDGGGKEVKQAIVQNKFPKSRIKACGVNTLYCVLSTVRELTQKLSTAKVEVIGEACNARTPEAHRAGLRKLADLKRVKVKS